MGKKALIAVLFIIFSASFSVYSFFRAYESLSLVGSKGYVKDIARAETVGDDDLHKIIAARENIYFSDPALARSDLALAKIILANRTDNPQAKKVLLEDARTALEESLRMNPGNPYAWFRLAHVLNLLGGKPELILSALKLSFMTGPHEPRLVFNRLPLALALMNSMDETTQAFLQHQIRFAWRKSGRQTAFLSVSFGMTDYFSEIISSADPEGIQRFQTYISFIEELRDRR